MDFDRFKKREWSSRKRVVRAGAIYHLIQHSTGNEKYFFNNEDKDVFIRILKYVKDTYSLSVYAYVLMDNHIHILFKTNEANLPSAVKCLLEMYSKYVNKTYNRKGALVRGRYRALHVDYVESLYPICLYIHNNPVKAGMVIAPEDYCWSSLREYLGDKRRKIIDENYLSENLKDNKIHSKYFANKATIIGSMGIRQRSTKNDMNELKDFIAEYFLHEKINSVNFKDLYKNNINKNMKEKTKMEILHCFKRIGFNYKEIAERLDLHPRTVSRMLAKKTLT